jgi:hypothetical protein
MVDDRTQRPFGANEPARSAPKAGSSGNDPLAELARLIGQNDPFGEFGRDNARRASAPPAHEPPQAWTDVPHAAPEPAAQEPQRVQHAVPNFLTAKPAPSTMPPNFGNHAFGKQAFGSTPPNDDMYQVEGGAPAYAAAPMQGYENDPYQPNNSQFAAEPADYYEEEPKSRKRMGILVIAGVFALAVIGTAGAFGYRAIFGSSSASVPPPVIKADTTPSKVVPAATAPNKQITDRINDKGMGERLVSREEQPVAITPQPDAMPQSSAPSGSGVVNGAEPKKVRTIAIRPDQGMADPAAQSASASAAPPPSVPAPTSQPTPVRVIPTAKPAATAPPQRAASNPPPAADDAEPAPAARPAPAPRAAANAPLSLNPNAAPARAAAPAAQPARTASLPPAPASGGGGGYLVQVSSQRSEGEAQSAFASLQGKFPGQLGGKQAVIRKVELGEKGTYYRAMVSAGDAAEANQLCNGIKAAGGSCLVQKN